MIIQVRCGLYLASSINVNFRLEDINRPSEIIPDVDGLLNFSHRTEIERLAQVQSKLFLPRMKLLVILVNGDHWQLEFIHEGFELFGLWWEVLPGEYPFELTELFTVIWGVELCQDQFSLVLRVEVGVNAGGRIAYDRVGTVLVPALVGELMAVFGAV